MLVAGGEGYGGHLASAELYDPSTGTWTVTGSLNSTRSFDTATLLPSGKVLIAGGEGNSGPLASTELYDPSTGTWTVTGSLNTARFYHTMTLLPSGQVLIAGGSNTGNTPLASAELYDPSTGTWTVTGSLNAGRFLYTATLLSSGQVLVAGGRGYDGINGYLASAELYSQTQDTTPPVLSLPGTITVDATSPAGAVVTYTVTATDPDDPPSQLTITCTPASGSTFPIGITTVNCTASDPAGNSSTGSFQVVVKGAPAQVSDLITTVNSFNLPSGIQNSLVRQLQAVQKDIAANNITQACSDLQSFDSHVDDLLQGRKLTKAQHDQLKAASKQIQDVLGC